MNATTEQPAGLALTCPHCGSGAIVMVGGSGGAGVLACEDCGEVFALRRKMTPPPSDDGGGDDDEAGSGDSSGEGSGGASPGGGDEDEDGPPPYPEYEAPPKGREGRKPATREPASSEELATEKPAWLTEPGTGEPQPGYSLPKELQCTSEEEVRLIFTGFSRRIGQILKDNTFSRPQPGKRRGEINPRALYKGGIRHGSPRIFQQQEDIGGRKYGFVLCIDGSGSMHTNLQPFIPAHHRSWAGRGRGVMRSELAGYATQMIVDGLIKNNVPVVALLGGWVRGHGVSYIYGDKGQHKVASILRRVVSGTGGGNTDYLLAASAAKEVAKMRKADPDIHPIVVYIVDGEIGPFEDCAVVRPVDKHGREIINGDVYADSSSGVTVKIERWYLSTIDTTDTGLRVMGAGALGDLSYSVEVTQLHVINDQLLKSGADIITIGLEDKRLRRWYPNCAVVSSEAEFVAALTGGIKKAVKNHQKRIRK